MSGLPKMSNAEMVKQLEAQLRYARKPPCSCADWGMMGCLPSCDSNKTWAMIIKERDDLAEKLDKQTKTVRLTLSHPTIDCSYYAWLGKADRKFIDKMIEEKSAHGLLMYAFQAGRTTAYREIEAATMKPKNESDT